MRTLLVTGGAGFIGSCFVRQMLVHQDTRIVNLDKLTYAGSLASVASVLGDPRHHFIRGDICDRALLNSLITEHCPTAVVNFAAESHVDRSIANADRFIETNVLGTYGLLEAARAYWDKLTGDKRSAFRFLQVSTDEVFGSLGPTGHFDEHSCYAPNSPYAASKAAADQFVRAYHRTFGLPVVTTFGSNNFGPYQYPEKLIPLTITRALKGLPLPIYGDGRQVRDWLFVEDHCRAIGLAVEHGRPGEAYAIGANCERTNLEIVQSICRLVDQLCPNLMHRPTSSLIRFVRDRPGHDQRYATDSTKARRELGWEPVHSFEQALSLTVQWYLDNESPVEAEDRELEIAS